MQSWRHPKAAGRCVIFVTASTRKAGVQGRAEVGSRSEDAMDLSTKLKITAVTAAVLMAVVWAVPVPV